MKQYNTAALINAGARVEISSQATQGGIIMLDREPDYENEKYRMWIAKKEETEKYTNATGEPQIMGIEITHEKLFEIRVYGLSHGFSMKFISKIDMNTGDITVVFKILNPDGDVFFSGIKSDIKEREYYNLVDTTVESIKSAGIFEIENESIQNFTDMSPEEAFKQMMGENVPQFILEKLQESVKNAQKNGGEACES